MKKILVRFATDANENVGFGHVARCLLLAKRIAESNPFAIFGFCGDFSDNACRLISENLPNVAINAIGARNIPTLSIFDAMADKEDPDVFDVQRLKKVCKSSTEVICLVSGKRTPPQHSNLTCIGYTLGGPCSTPPKLYWGLHYAPAGIDESVTLDAQRDRTRAFIGLGGGKGSKNIRLVLRAIARLDEITRVDVLVSPVNEASPDRGFPGPDQGVYLHWNVPSVVPFLASAGVVVTSYGHLGYEALACGAPLCLVGQKRFQAEYADALAAEGCCVAAGYLSESSEEALAAAISDTLARAGELSATARRTVDGCGLDRIAVLIMNKLQDMS